MLNMHLCFHLIKNKQTPSQITAQKRPFTLNGLAVNLNIYRTGSWPSVYRREYPELEGCSRRPGQKCWQWNHNTHNGSFFLCATPIFFLFFFFMCVCIYISSVSIQSEHTAILSVRVRSHIFIFMLGRSPLCMSWNTDLRRQYKCFKWLPALEE